MLEWDFRLARIWCARSRNSVGIWSERHTSRPYIASPLPSASFRSYTSLPSDESYRIFICFMARCFSAATSGHRWSSWKCVAKMKDDCL